MSESKSISHCQGKGSLSHNNRDFSSKNVDSNRTDDNITFIRDPIAEAYEKCFGAAVNRYNERQPRADRQIKTSYYESTFNHAPCNTVITSSDNGLLIVGITLQRLATALQDVIPLLWLKLSNRVLLSLLDT